MRQDEASKELGRRAEEYAARYVAALPGWRILERNAVNRYGEIDIVAMDDNAHELVVVEVRCRTIGEVQSPLDSVGPKKLRALVNAGRALADEMRWEGFWRIDLIGITINSEQKGKLEHIRDITAGQDIFS